jgi:hypothetical protein
MTDQTGPDADPFPGVVLVYGTDEEDGYAIRQSILAPGKSITFKTPWLINPKDEVYLMAFFLDIVPGGSKRGSYKLSVTAAEKTVTKVIINDLDSAHRRDIEWEFEMQKLFPPGSGKR